MPDLETFRTLYCDPGEDAGWCIARGFTLLGAGTHKMWDHADHVWAALNDPYNECIPMNDVTYARNGITRKDMTGPIERIVCEDWRLYPDKLQDLAWDQCRTARLIGALSFMARLHGIPFILQPASIKEAAKAAGAEELYYKPVTENRHQNDAIQHYVWYTNDVLMNLHLRNDHDKRSAGEH